MKERGMIFNAEMVRAILDGRKTQTRRIMKNQPVLNGNLYEVFGAAWSKGVTSVPAVPGHSLSTRCPFGEVGDRIWVRETFAAFDADWKFPGRPHDLKDGPWPNVIYPASRSEVPPGTLRPSIHMPRWASRITLEITGVRVERLNDISHDDAGREGIHTEVWDQTVVARNYAAEDEFFQFWSESMPHYVEMNELFRASFHSLWQSIYGEESWQANPWVWVIEFRRIEGGAA